MDEFDRLADAYARQASAGPSSKLDLLMHLERIRDGRVVPFLLNVLRDSGELEQVRIDVLRRLRNGDGVVGSTDRASVATTMGEVLADESASADLRLQAALALGGFTDIDGVLSRLGTVCLARHESIDLRYAAFTSLERAEHTPRSIELLRELSEDETLGSSARRVLRHVREDNPHEHSPAAG